MRLAACCACGLLLLTSSAVRAAETADMLTVGAERAIERKPSRSILVVECGQLDQRLDSRANTVDDRPQVG